MDLENVVLSSEQEEKIKSKTPDKMPLNPTAQGWSGSEVRRFLTRSISDSDGSLLSELKSKLSIIQTLFQSVFNDGNGNIQNQINDLYSAIEGAINNIDLIQLNTDPVLVVSEAGQIGWNESDGTYNFGLLNGSIGQAFQETLIYAKADEDIEIGDAIMFKSVQGNHFLVGKADPVLINQNPELFIGISTNQVLQGNFFYTNCFGKINDFPVITYGFELGNILWFDSSSSQKGKLTNVEPPRDKARIRCAVVVKESQNQNQPFTGIVFVRPTILEKEVGVKTFISSEEPSDSIQGDIWFKIIV